MNFLSTTAGKLITGVFLVIIVYYLLVYYKGGNAYLGNASSAFTKGTSALMGGNNRSYATGG